MKIVFLDIDGVMNNKNFFLETKKDPYFDHVFDPKSVAALNAILEATGAKIIISSTWRRSHSLEYLQQVLDSNGVKGKIVGQTPMKLSYVARGIEIWWWLEMEAEEGRFHTYVAIDDDTEMYKVHPRTVATTWETGLGPEHVQAAIDILNKEPTDDFKPQDE